MTVKIAIAGSDLLFLEYVLDALAESDLAENKVKLFSASELDTGGLDYRGQMLTFLSLDTLGEEKPDLLLVFEKPTVVEAYRELFMGMTCPILGYQQDILALEPNILELPDDDSGKTAREEVSRILGIRKPPVQVLQHLFDGCQLEELDVILLAGASVYGQQGVNALAAQTARLLNAQGLETDVYGRQLAFNAYPMSETPWGSMINQSLEADLGEAFSSVDVFMSHVQVPVFYGVMLKVSAVLSGQPDLQEFIDRLEGKTGTHIDDEHGSFSILDGVSLDGEVLLSHISLNKRDNHRLDAWISFDDLKYSAKFQLISAADFLLKHHL